VAHHKPARVVAAVVLTALLAFGGYAAWFHLATGDGVDVVGDDPRILVRQDRYSGMDALLSGTLGFDPATKCLVVVTSSGDTFGVVWPAGTRPAKSGSERGVRIGAFLGRFGGFTVMEGDKVEGGGGGGELPSMDPELSRCAEGDVFIFTDNVRVVGESTGAAG